MGLCWLLPGTSGRGMETWTSLWLPSLQWKGGTQVSYTTLLLRVLSADGIGAETTWVHSWSGRLSCSTSHSTATGINNSIPCTDFETVRSWHLERGHLGHSRGIGKPDPLMLSPSRSAGSSGWAEVVMLATVRHTLRPGLGSPLGWWGRTVPTALYTLRRKH